ncbi:MAG: low temperature requirement protein A [Acidimicrobiales bacterium]
MRAAIESYTYLHFWMILGIVITAVGIEEVLAHAREDAGLGGFAAACLCLGSGTYLAAHVLSWMRLDGVVKRQRLATAAALVLVTPVAAWLRPLAALACVAAVLGALVVFETLKYAAVRTELARART